VTDEQTAADAEIVEGGEAPGDAVAPPADAVAAQAVAHHDAATHMDAHTSLSDDDHGHAEAALGPIDWGVWGYAIVGGIAAVIVLAFFWLALGGLPA
jgi:hypothetical protein